jgi:tetratricopeptide (TPR) repeat protein
MVSDYLDRRGTGVASRVSNPSEELMRSRADRWSRPRVEARRVVLGVTLVLATGCHKFEARVQLKQGNALYENESYREALAQFQKGLEIDPAATFAWRSVGLTAMALHRPGVEGEENDQYAQTAIDAFNQYLADYPNDQKVEQYLTTVLINSSRWEEALARLERQAKARPGDAEIERAVVTTLMKAGRLEEALARARRPGGKPDPQLLYGIGVACWGQSYGDPTLDPQTRIKVVDMGLDATKQSIDLDPEFFDAMAYYNLLFREKAKLATTFEEAEQLTAQADLWLKKALELRERQKEAGVGTGIESESS